MSVKKRLEKLEKNNKINAQETDVCCITEGRLPFNVPRQITVKEAVEMILDHLGLEVHVEHQKPIVRELRKIDTD